MKRDLTSFGLYMHPVQWNWHPNSLHRESVFELFLDFTQAAIPKHRNLGELTSKHLFLMVPAGFAPGKSPITFPGDS